MHIFYSTHLCTLKFVSYDRKLTVVKKVLIYFSFVMDIMFPMLKTLKTLPMFCSAAIISFQTSSPNIKILITEGVFSSIPFPLVFWLWSLMATSNGCSSKAEQKPMT